MTALADRPDTEDGQPHATDGRPNIEDSLPQATDREYARRMMTVIILSIVGTGSATLILGASLSDVAKSFNTDAKSLSWVISAPLLAAGVGTSLCGRLGDMHGHRRLFISGSMVFSASLVLSALAWNPSILIAGRVLTGLGASAMQPNASALIMGQFDEAARAKAMGWYQMLASSVPVLALTIAGPIIDAFGSWRPIFWLILPISLSGLIGSIFVIRESPPGPPVPLDIAGALTVSSGVLSMLLAVDRGAHGGFDRPLPLALFALGALLLVTFVFVERRQPVPMLRLDYFKRRNFSAPIISASLVNFVYFGASVTLPLMLRKEFGFTLSTVSWVVIWRPLAFALGSPVGGSLAGRIGERKMITAGNTAVFFAMILLAVGAYEHHLWIVIVGLVVSGAGNGAAQPSSSTSVVSSVDRGDMGIAAGAYGTCLQLSAVIGIQLMSAVQGSSVTDHAFGRTFAFAACVTVGSVIAATFVRRRVPDAPDVLGER